MYYFIYVSNNETMPNKRIIAYLIIINSVNFYREIIIKIREVHERVL